MKHVKLFENFQEENFDKDRFKINDEYTLLLWKDEDDDLMCVSIGTTDEIVKADNDELADMVCFAHEDRDDKSVEVMDHGLIPEQYLSKEETQALYSIGLKVGDKFKTIEEFWAFVKNSKK